jgi:hypothetical protein
MFGVEPPGRIKAMLRLGTLLGLTNREGSGYRLSSRGAYLFHLVEKEYKAGVGSLVRLNEAQRDLIASQVQLAGARVSLRQAWYGLRASTGEIVKIFTH